MKRSIIILTALFCAPVHAQEPPSDGDASIVFSTYPSLKRIRTEISAGTLEYKNGHRVYWLRKTVQKYREASRSPQWTDTDSCPEMRGLFESLNELPMPRPKVFTEWQQPGSASNKVEELWVAADGTQYVLETEAAYPQSTIGKIRITSSDDTPLAKWVEQALSVLSHCWTDKPRR